MSSSFYLEPLLQDSEDSLQWMKISQVFYLQEKSITLRFNSIRCADRCRVKTLTSALAQPQKALNEQYHDTKVAIIPIRAKDFARKKHGRHGKNAERSGKTRKKSSQGCREGYIESKRTLLSVCLSIFVYFIGRDMIVVNLLLISVLLFSNFQSQCRECVQDGQCCL